MNDLISVIVSTYNREDALDAVLRALGRQSDPRFEIVVADDGSGPRTARVVAARAQASPVPLRHVWHQDRGFRLAAIRNRAILASRGAYVVFLDGDCIARPGFVAAHRRLAEPSCFVTGNRLLMSEALTAQVLARGLEPESWGWRRWMAQRARGDINRVTPLLTLPLGPLRARLKSRWLGARGANMAFWRADLDRVDGFDAAFEGWGREDSDIFIRMIRAGIGRKDGRWATAVVHLWHREADRAALAGNDHRLEELMHGDRITARAGLTAVAAD